jgi:hypothetical protein
MVLYVASALKENFNKLPKEVREKLIVTLAEKDTAAGNVAYTVQKHLDDLPTDVQQILFKLAEKDTAAGNVAYVLQKNFDKFPKEVREKLLLKFANV